MSKKLEAPANAPGARGPEAAALGVWLHAYRMELGVFAAAFLVLAGFSSQRFWRQSAEDGVYNIFTEVQRRAAGSRARHVGNQYTLQFVWQFTPHVSWLTTISYFTAGKFLRETPPGENVTYFTTWWAYRF